MHKNTHKQAGFSAVEAILLIVIVGSIAGIGYYVYHTSQKTSDTYNSSTEVSNTTTAKVKAKPVTTTASTPATTSTDTQDLQSSLNDATNSSNQGNQDLSASTTSLGDTSTYTSN
jgi:hypothetical protein